MIWRLRDWLFRHKKLVNIPGGDIGSIIRVVAKVNPYAAYRIMQIDRAGKTWRKPVSLYNAFGWNDTIEGFDYWERIHDTMLCCRHDYPIVSEADKLRAAIRHERWHRLADLVAAVDVRASMRVREEARTRDDTLVSSLYDAFTWRHTAEGNDYWSYLHQRLLDRWPTCYPMQDDDK